MLVFFVPKLIVLYFTIDKIRTYPEGYVLTVIGSISY